MQQQAAERASPKIRNEWPGLPGSKVAGLCPGDSGKPDYWLVLLADKPQRELNWQSSIDWVAGLGAALPTRDESALLYAFLRDEFEAGWHWTGTQYSSDCAWGQYFGNGYQGNYGKKVEARARAVRRLPLQSFNPSKDDPVAQSPAKPDLAPALLRQLLDETKGLRTDMRTIFLADTEAA